MQLDSTLFMSSINVSHELTSPNGMWFSILILTLLSNDDECRLAFGLGIH